MLRLEPTIIRLTPTETKDFDQQLRFKRCLERQRSQDSAFFSKTLRGSRYQQLRYPSPGCPNCITPLPHSTATSALDPLEVDTSAASLSVDEGETYANSIVEKHETWELQPGIGQLADSTLSLSNSPRLPLPLPFSATARTSSSATPLRNIQQARGSGAMEQSEANLRRGLVTPRRGSLAAIVQDEQSESQNPTTPLAFVDPALSVWRLNVYDDSLTATVQPQTPRNLPEARYQNRLQGFYTALGGRQFYRVAVAPEAFRPRRLAGAASPPGLSAPGFAGLLGGMENLFEASSLDTAMRRWATLQPGRSEDEHNSG